MARDYFYNEFFLSIPRWQEELGVLEIFWVVEVHDLFVPAESYFPSNKWEVTSDGFHISAINRTTRFFCIDEMSLVADIAATLAEKHPDALVIRVLRATANPSYADTIQELATSETPKNMYCLWIREDIAQCGFFREQQEDQSLVDRLLDSRPTDFVELLTTMNVRRTNLNDS
jgi:hypothetical protein